MRPTGQLTTPFTRLLGIRYPIMSAPMGRGAPPELVAAVTNAGGVGAIGLSWDRPQRIRELIARIQHLTAGPFIANFVLAFDQHERLETALDAGANIVSFFWGDASDYIRIAKRAGALVCHTIGSPDEARRGADLGANVLIAQGHEAGGHIWGKVATMALVPAVVDAAGGVPVIAAGGIADGRGLAAALMLGASGACLGTRFLATPEAGYHSNYKQLLLAASVSDTAETTVFDGGWPNAPERVLRNKVFQRWETAGRPSAGARPGENDRIGQNADGSPIMRYSIASLLQDAPGDIEDFVVYAGQSVGLIKDVLPASELVARIAAEAIDAFAAGGQAA